VLIRGDCRLAAVAEAGLG